MNGKIGLAVMVAAFLAGGTGCVTYHYRGYHEATHPTAPPAFPIPVREQVYLFMMNGTDVLELSGMLGLRDHVCKAGYSKVYYAQQMDAEWYNRELRRVARDEPNARIVLLGFGTAAQPVLNLAAGAVRDQLPLDAVVFLDPVGLNGNLAETVPVQTVVVRSHNWRGSRGLVGSETVLLPRVGHFSAPSNSATVDTIVRLMTASAALVRVDDSAERLPHLPLNDKPAPTPRGYPPAVWAGPPDEWDFLKPLPAFPCLPEVAVPTVP